MYGQKEGERTGPSPVDRRKPGTEMHILPDANRLRLPLVIGTPAGNVHACEGPKPMAKGHQTHHETPGPRQSRPQGRRPP